MEDWENFEEQTPEELRRSFVKDFWERNEKKCESGSHYSTLYKPLVDRLNASAEKENRDPYLFERELWEVEEIFDGITDAFKAWWWDAPEHQFWCRFDGEHVIQQPKEWGDDSPISQESLDIATAKYLDRPWMQSNLLDWYIINAFVKDELLRFAARVRTGMHFNKVNLAYAFSGGNQFKMILWRPALALINFFVKWVLLPAIAGGLYYFGYETVALWVIGFFGVLVVFRIIFLPRSIMRWRALKKARKEADGVLVRLNQIRVLCQNSTLNPTHLKNQLAEAEKEAPLFKPAVHAILDRAIERDPAVFTTGS